MIRVFTACHGTQLLVIQHLRAHLALPQATDLLLWHPMDDNPFIGNFMRGVIDTAGFADVLDIRDFHSLRPRTQGALSWLVESPRRLRRDAAELRGFVERNGASEEVELWADEPMHFYVTFPRAVLRQARHVHIPHCFNHEDASTPVLKARLQAAWDVGGWPKRHVFQPWQRLASGGVDMRPDGVAYDCAYTFDRPSCWAADSIDISHLITLDAFEATYRTLPAAMRQEVEAVLAPIQAAARPIVLLLLFGLDPGPEPRLLYQQAIERIFRKRSAELSGCTLAVKVHPGAKGGEEKVFIDWLRANIPAQVHPIMHPLNAEFMLPRLRPDYVVAGLCGALPTVARLAVAKPVAIAELVEAFERSRPADQPFVRSMLSNVERW